MASRRPGGVHHDDIVKRGGESPAARTSIRAPKISVGSPGGGSGKPPMTAGSGARRGGNTLTSPSALDPLFPSDDGAGAASARRSDDHDRDDGDFFSAEKAFENFEAKMRTMQEVKAINSRVEGAVASFLSDDDNARQREVDLLKTKTRMSGLMERHVLLGGKRDTALRNLNDWFERFGGEEDTTYFTDGDRVDGVLYAAQDGLRLLDARVAAGEDVVIHVCVCPPIARS